MSGVEGLSSLSSTAHVTKSRTSTIPGTMATTRPTYLALTDNLGESEAGGIAAGLLMRRVTRASCRQPRSLPGA